jgi:chaperonin GroES
MKIIQAVSDKVFVKVLKEEEKTSGGLIVPATAKKEPQSYGVVLSVGSDVKGIKLNDVVVFHSHAGQVVLLESQEYKIIMYPEIYGVVTEKD